MNHRWGTTVSSGNTSSFAASFESTGTGGHNLMDSHSAAWRYYMPFILSKSKTTHSSSRPTALEFLVPQNFSVNGFLDMGRDEISQKNQVKGVQSVLEHCPYSLKNHEIPIGGYIQDLGMANSCFDFL